jgi:predicted transcriptional regulator of viral defense system
MNDILRSANPQNERVRATELALWLLSRGISSITTDEIAVLLAIPINQVPQRLAALKRRGEIVLLANGVWAPVPPEYAAWGAPPAIDIIDAIMKHFDVKYYVGWLSAAALHGASHQAPQVFQVATSRAIREKMIGRSKLRFYHRTHISSITTVDVESRSGSIPISSKETTMLDIVNDIGIVGGIDNAANLIIELCETYQPDIDALLALSTHYPTSAIRRLGFLMERFTDIIVLDQLKSISDKRKTPMSMLDPQSANIGWVDKYWKLKINREVYPDV